MGEGHHWACIVALVAAWGCGEKGREPAQPAPDPAKHEAASRSYEGVLFHGCVAVVRGPRCELTPGETTELAVWAPHPDASALGAAVDGVAAPVRHAGQADAGTLFVVTLERPTLTDASQLVIDFGARGRWSLGLRPALVAERVDEAKAIRRTGKLDEAAERLGDPEGLPEAVRGLALGELGRIALRKGELDQAAELLLQAAAHHRSRGRVSDEINDATAAAYVLADLKQEVSRARAVIGELEADAPQWPYAEFLLGWHRSNIAYRNGELRQTLRHLVGAERVARRFKLPGKLYYVSDVRANMLVELGRADDAVAVYDALDRGALDACQRMSVDNNACWAQLRVAKSNPEAASERVRDAITRCQRALQLARAETCPRSTDIELNALLNLALATLEQGERDAARRWLEEAEAKKAGFNGERLAWLIDLQARLQLLDGAFEAAHDRFGELVERGRAAALSEPIWRGELGRGAALEAQGRLDEASAAYARAEETIDEHGMNVPLGEGRASFFSERDRSARRLVDVLVRLGEPSRAAAVARISRARALASMRRMDRLASLPPGDRAKWESAIARYRRERKALSDDAAEDWKLPKDKLAAALEARRARREALKTALDDAFSLLGANRLDARALPAPSEGELTLIYYPSARPDRWFGFALTAAGATVVEIALPSAGDPPPETLSGLLLEPFSAQIGAARRLRLLPYGRLRQVDFHALPWAEGALVDRIPVAYGVDLPAPEAPAGVERKALIVVDPRSDLPWALAEGKGVKASLGDAWQVTGLVGDRATPQNFSGAITDASLLHFAGHGVFAGETGWESALSLAGESQLTVGDILALPRVPRHVVLSGCETGKTKASSRALSVSLAHSFVAAGAEAVVAAVRPVEDELAGAMAKTLYADAARPGWDLVTAFRDAQRAAKRELPHLDWAAYRLITR